MLSRESCYKLSQSLSFGRKNLVCIKLGVHTKTIDGPFTCRFDHHLLH